ncbi:uncharacterized protein LOC115884060 [Sitophilus oryzae]|uniref:Uncharacterized protein LOC115884060 n=1 Tax=Sitophilus oryzae TaxID=7048 RepID=A0A6J2Y5V7_SITOR|nr:uncharacterized protein LOC115884060 [Sitophilus oryzae]
MELNSDIIGLQGVILTVKSKIGELSSINYSGGNEEKLNVIVEELRKYFTNKGYYKESKINEKSTKELNNLIFFLALNTSFKNHPNFAENPHLINIIPQLSKCVLANVCFDLKLFPQYCYLIENMPLDLTQELLDQIIECLKKTKPSEYLEIAFSLLKAVVNKLSNEEISNKTEDTIDDIIIVTGLILNNLTGLFTDQMETMIKKQIYVHMGFTLLKLLDLLLYIDENIVALTKIVNSVISVTCIIVKSVTLDIFCEWAEVEYIDRSLQVVVAEKAYHTISKYQKCKLASELVSLLGNIARKPKTLMEQIQEADTETIIKRINAEDENQKAWFKALLNTSVFNNTDALECLNKWWMLCDESDVDRLLSLPKNTQNKGLILKCAGNLQLDGLKRILTIYFHRQKFIWKEDIQNETTLLFNQHQNDFSEQDLKNILLLILQNAELFFKHFYTAAFNTNLSVYNKVFEITNEIIKIDHVGINIIWKVLEENEPKCENINKYINFIENLLHTQCYTWDYIVSNIILRLINKHKVSTGSLEGLSSSLTIFKHFSHLSCEFTRELELFEFILICASEYRCKSFVDFNSANEEVTRHCIDYILQKCRYFKEKSFHKDHVSIIGHHLDDPWSNYYKSSAFANEHSTLLNYIIPNFELSCYTEGKADQNFSSLIKVLPKCATPEWEIILKEMSDKWGFSITLKALTDILILLCEVTNQSKSEEKPQHLTVALKFCLQMFGKFLQSQAKNKQEQILAIQNLCRLLKHLPEVLKQTEGIYLINILPQEAYKDLAQDKDFIARIVLINDKQVCKVLAEKILQK